MTHGKILLRSPKDSTKGHMCNVDVIFDGVDYLEIPLLAFCFTFVEPRDEEKNRVENCIGRRLHPHTQVYVLASKASRFLVVADEVRVETNELSLNESSLSHWGDEN